MARLFVLALIFFAASASAGLGEESGSTSCSGFPWRVTAAPYGGYSVAVTVCGTYAGCQPHNPQFSVSGTEIRITLTAAEPLSDCICVAVVDVFSETVIIPSLAPGAYTVTATLMHCGQPTPVGGTSFVFGAASAIPTLNPAAAVAFAILLAALAVLRLRN